MIADRLTDEPCGVVGVMYPDDWPEPEIAWTVFGASEGKGVAYETTLMAGRYAYDILKWSSVISCVMTGNSRSEALAQRLGAVFERVFDHPEYGPMNIWRHPAADSLS
jgi:RimJ/RimL family protein N-acetyltransferase